VAGRAIAEEDDDISFLSESLSRGSLEDSEEDQFTAKKRGERLSSQNSFKLQMPSSLAIPDDNISSQKSLISMKSSSKPKSRLRN